MCSSKELIFGCHILVTYTYQQLTSDLKVMRLRLGHSGVAVVRALGLRRMPSQSCGLSSLLILTYLRTPMITVGRGWRLDTLYWPDLYSGNRTRVRYAPTWARVSNRGCVSIMRYTSLIRQRRLRDSTWRLESSRGRAAICKALQNKPLGCQTNYKFQMNVCSKDLPNLGMYFGSNQDYVMCYMELDRQPNLPCVMRYGCHHTGRVSSGCGGIVRLKTTKSQWCRPLWKQFPICSFWSSSNLFSVLLSIFFVVTAHHSPAWLKGSTPFSQSNSLFSDLASRTSVYSWFTSFVRRSLRWRIAGQFRHVFICHVELLHFTVGDCAHALREKRNCMALIIQVNASLTWYQNISSSPKWVHFRHNFVIIIDSMIALTCYTLRPVKSLCFRLYMQNAEYSADVPGDALENTRRGGYLFDDQFPMTMWTSYHERCLFI